MKRIKINRAGGLLGYTGICVNRYFEMALVAARFFLARSPGQGAWPLRGRDHLRPAYEQKMKDSGIGDEADKR
jgi:hypothetical protein